ncbi:MAG: RIP metalloprotease [Hyphomonadaceae bacterium]|nr:RIP metalloprotease [Hyphomonadaceae bacterium]
MEQLTSALIYAGAFISVLGLVVFVHEFGHYQVGRWCGIAVKSFSIGFGKEWFGWTDRHGTRWKVSRIPIGGFVSWADDSDPTSAGPATEEHKSLSLEEARARGHFRAMPIWKRAAATAAGPAANFVFSISVIAVLLMTHGRDATDYARLPARVDGVQAGSAAATAGLSVGDVILRADTTDIPSFAALQTYVADRAGQPVTLTVRREGADITVPITPDRAEVPDARGGAPRTVGRLGIARTLLPEERVMERLGPLAAIGAGAQSTWNYVAVTGAYIGAVLTGKASGDQISGPAGIFAASGQVATEALGMGAEQDQRSAVERAGALALSLLNWAALLSVAVGIANLLPIPLLDGGQLVFFAAEAVRGGKPLPARVQEAAFWTGAFTLASLFLFATWNDVQRHWQDLQNFFS